MSATKMRVAVVGATGIVGREIVKCLNARRFPFHPKIKLFASHRSIGRRLPIGRGSVSVQQLAKNCFDDVDLAFFASTSSNAKRFASLATQSGATVIDNSSAFRMTPSVPLVVPEVNMNTALSQKGASIIANPNCSTILLALALAPLHKQYGLDRVDVTTYQAVSGAGQAGVDELKTQAINWVQNEPLEPSVFASQTLFNCFSHDSPVNLETGYNGEEDKIIQETQKILGARVRVTATCVRVPVLRAHCESVSVTLKRTATTEGVRDLLAAAPGLRMIDNRVANKFPEPLDATRQDSVRVGRVREDLSQPAGRGFHFFLAGDQILKGAALNAVQIAEHLAEHLAGHLAEQAAHRDVFLL